MTTNVEGQVQKESRTFSTMTQDLLALLDWLQAAGCTHIAMESTGSYWRPVYNLLEGQFTLLVGNAYHMKTVPGRKTDVKDAEWIADLLRHGLIRGSFIPAPTQRQLRDLTRYRTHVVEERARLTNRLQTVLEDANVKLASVVTDIRGVSARAILAALLAGETDPVVLAELARGRMRSKREVLAQAVVGRFTPHHAFLITEHLSQLDYLEDAVERVGAEITKRLADDQVALELLDTLPGVGQRAAEIMLAEVGTDLSRFPSAEHLASWAGLCPGNKESGGKRLSGKTRGGNIWLRHVLFEVAHAASKTKDTYLSAQYRRLATRRGKRRALVALGHSILVSAYHILTRRVPYRELGPLYFNGAGSARQEYRTPRGLNFVWGIMRAPVPRGPGHYGSVPIGLSLYLTEEQARPLKLPYQSRSALAREIVNFVAAQLPARPICVLSDGGYATKDYLQQLPATVNVVGRMLSTGKLYARPPQSRGPRRGCPPKRGPVLGAPKPWARQRGGWQPHSSEAGAFVQAWEGVWPAALPGRLLRVVVVRRPTPTRVRKPGQRKPPPPVEAFFTTALALSLEAILAQYRERWAVESTIRDSNTFAGFGQAQCRKRERVVGANTFRLVLTAARTLWFVEHTVRTPALELGRYRPWYHQKCAPSQLDIVWTWREALPTAKVFPIPRFTPGLAEIHRAPETAPPLAASYHCLKDRSI
jgi:transposase